MPTRKKGVARRKKFSPEQLPIPIVGIGASAGGLEAFSQLLEHLPTDTGMAFVLVQHMDTHHESMLKNLLKPKTKIPVLEVKDGMEPEANHVYVIPPNTGMTIEENALHLAPRGREQKPHMPIDDFFRSLAADRQSRAIGVILSGTATDGTLGLKAIKAEGGITFAQDEKSAKFSGMPGNAVTAGCVDFVLTPEKIAKELPRVLDHPYVKVAPTVEELQQPLDGDLQRICSVLHRATGVDFTSYKPSTIRRRIGRRMALHRIDNITQYIAHLQRDTAEVKNLYEDILIHVTGFFREPDMFRALQEEVLPEILNGRDSDHAVRIWAPGCSTGEEVYSIAICLFEHLSQKRLTIPFGCGYFGTTHNSRRMNELV